MASGQVYVIRSTKESTSTLADPELSEFFGVPCIKGVSMDWRPGSWTEGTTACVPLAHIVSVVIFASRQEYTEMARRFHKDEAPKS